MDRLTFINILNQYFVDIDLRAKQNIVDNMNLMIADHTYRNHLDLFFMAISITQSYGFLSYLTIDEKNYFLLSDYFKSNSYQSKNIDYLNSGQLSLLNEISVNSKSFISAPTSFGKTSIINEYVLNNIDSYDFVIYVVPTNSLVEELYTKFVKYLKGRTDINISTQPIKKTNIKNILFLTPERFMVFIEEFNIDKVDLIIMDETYKIMDYKKEKVSDFINSRDVRFRKVADIIGRSKTKTIYLSPFTYELTDSMRRFLEKHQIKKIDRKIEYVKHDIICLASAREFKKMFPESSHRYIANLRSSQKVSSILLNLIDQKNIVYVDGYGTAYSITEDFKHQIEINDNRFKVFIKHLNENFSIDENTRWKVMEALEKGIGIYIAPIPRYIKKEMIRLFEQNLLHTLVVTTSFTEGVNSNAKNLIFTSLNNGVGKLSPIDILNVAGRAGRFGMNSVGKIYCIKKEIYNKLIELQKDGIIKLENYNYYLDESGKPKSVSNPYEIDMMEDEYLSDEDKSRKEKYKKWLDDYGLSSKDMYISLNVSNFWKAYLYMWLHQNPIYHEKYYNAILNIADDKKKTESLDIIFKAIRDCFASRNPTEDPFPVNPWDIHAFDSSGNFTWGRLYSIYLSGSLIKIIRNNRIFIKKKYKEIIGNLSIKNQADIKELFIKRKSSWVLRYFKWRNDGFVENTDAFYTETFRFISNIVQYKIPYYLCYFSSIFKLYLSKNKTKFDGTCIDIKKIVMPFEDGISGEDEYLPLIDYGMSNDLLIKIKENNISFSNILNQSFAKEHFDEYELMMLTDFKNLMT